nr:MAG TPA: hypothetical protein [Caudoviricetes sp.]
MRRCRQERKNILYGAFVCAVELLRLCKLGLCALRQDYPFSQEKYGYACYSDTQLTRI